MRNISQLHFLVLFLLFGGHNVFPGVEHAMRTPANYSKMLTKAFIVILILYIPPAIAGYWAFGQNTKNVILDNLTRGVVPQIATIAITLHLLVTIPIINNPPNLWLEDVLKIDKSKKEILWRILVRVTLLAVQTLIACVVPLFFDVMNFIGATCVSATVFFLPCAMYLKIYWKQVRNLELAWIIVVLVTATLGSAIGLFNAVVSMYQNISGNSNWNPSSDVFYSFCLGVTGVGSILIGLGIWLISRSYSSKRNSLN